VAFRFKKAACVVAGTFNMYIVKPAWLSGIGIVPKGTPVVIHTNLDGPGFRFTSPKLPFSWSISPSHIEVDTESSEENCGEKVAAVLKALPHTPLVALGNNTVYSAPLSETAQLPDQFRGLPETPTGYAFAHRSFHFGLLRDARVTNLMLSITAEEVELSINVQTELRDHDTDAVQAAALRFSQDRQEAEVLVRQLFKANIEYENSNSRPA